MRTRKPTSSQTQSVREVVTARLGRGVVTVLLLGLCSVTANIASATATKSVDLTAASNGHVITVKMGTNVYVTLTGENWTFSSGGLNKVATLSGTSTWTKNKPVVTRGLPSACRDTCASEVAHYVALRTGAIRLLAQRTTCGAGLTCGAASRQWTVVLHVR